VIVSSVLIVLPTIPLGVLMLALGLFRLPTTNTQPSISD
jgi:hypothetical protein